jgi:hypothetical protein
MPVFLPTIYHTNIINHTYTLVTVFRPKYVPLTTAERSPNPSSRGYFGRTLCPIQISVWDAHGDVFKCSRAKSTDDRHQQRRLYLCVLSNRLGFNKSYTSYTAF